MPLVAQVAAIRGKKLVLCWLEGGKGREFGLYAIAFKEIFDIVFR